MPDQKPKRKNPYSDRRKAANQKWDKDNLDRLSLAIKKGKHDIIRSVAKAQGESVNHYIEVAIDQRLERDQTAAEDQTTGEAKH